jgi:predicted  nucleic acid-binding Zn-ribbon protein
MGETDNRAVCAECGYEFSDPSNQEACPQCGGTRRQIYLTMRETLELRESTVFQANRPGWKRFVRRIVNRTKLSRQGKKAREILDIDRSDLQKTKKYHHVEELINGQWETVHNEQEEFDAKRRPPQ